MGLFDKLKKGADALRKGVSFFSPLTGAQVAAGQYAAGNKKGAYDTIKLAGAGGMVGGGIAATLAGKPSLGIPLALAGARQGYQGMKGKPGSGAPDAGTKGMSSRSRAAGYSLPGESSGAGGGGGGSYEAGSYETEPPSSGGGYDSVLGMRGDTQSGVPNEAILARYSQKTPDEIRHASNVDRLAQMIGEEGTSLYNISNPTYGRALSYYGDILSGSKAAAAQAMAPEADQIAEMTDAQQKAIRLSGVRGGARDTALAEAGQAGASALAGLVPKARAEAAQAGSALAMQGMALGTEQQGKAASMYDTLRGAETQGRQFAVEAELKNRIESQGIDLQWAQTALQEKLGMRGLDLQEMSIRINERLQNRGLDIQQMLGMRSLDLQRELGLAGINLSQQQIDMMKKQMAQEASNAKGKMWGDLGGMFLSILPGLLRRGKDGGLPNYSSPNPSNYGGW